MNTIHEPLADSRGYCSRCCTDHSLPAGEAREKCTELMRLLEQKGRIDLMTPDYKADPDFSTDSLFGEARGKMFGVLVGQKQDGVQIALRAFSGQYNGTWTVEGWVPPLFDEEKLLCISHDVERRIKKIGKELEERNLDSYSKFSLLKKRKSLSQKLMKKIHSLYTVSNFRGQTIPLAEIFPAGGIPTGTGDCCAPKLLNYAARQGLIPLGMAEFYWGKGNRSGTRQHGVFYSPCTDKCQPMLGFLLCGL